jgi:hypothetical protein
MKFLHVFCTVQIVCNYHIDVVVLTRKVAFGSEGEGNEGEIRPSPQLRESGRHILLSRPYFDSSATMA